MRPCCRSGLSELALDAGGSGKSSPLWEELQVWVYGERLADLDLECLKS